MKNKSPIRDVRDAIAVVIAAIAITTALLFPTAPPVAGIANALAIALVLRVRR
ncbi:hypothetical protein [Mycobacterium sp.]|jgi:hypothetical protein|uniref:hypothetical protein n=1 Tax=Mycobacterium sp. TaxID=1785 RepID=UPI002D2E72FF|nr:hypothetical protein [Mycobacterium sp.]HZA11477.1 hypothetical protein [Mycobacterium sp.]